MVHFLLCGGMCGSFLALWRGVWFISCFVEGNTKVMGVTSDTGNSGRRG